MAKKAIKSGGSGSKRTAAKPRAAKAARKPAGSAKTAPRKPVRAKAAAPRRAASTRSSSKKELSASDALLKLIESPLVADLLAIGATAALAAIAGRGLSKSGGAGSTVKAAGKAAAAAMGKRLSTEVEEIRSATKARKGAKG